jgi:hypothetical protein
VNRASQMGHACRWIEANRDEAPFNVPALGEPASAAPETTEGRLTDALLRVLLVVVDVWLTDRTATH